VPLPIGWQVAEERALAGVCGNPRCSTPPLLQQAQQQAAKQRNRASSHGKWYTASADAVDEWDDGGESAHFCGAVCQAFVSTQAAMLGDPMQVSP